MKTSEIPKQACLYCGYKHEASTSFHNMVPRPGDISMCINCCKIAVFGKDLIQRLPTAEEKERIGKDRQVLPAKLAIRLSRQT